VGSSLVAAASQGALPASRAAGAKRASVTSRSQHARKCDRNAVIWRPALPEWRPTDQVIAFL